VTLPEHLPSRPGWDCRTCAAPWPCKPAQVRLAAEHGPTPLAILMWGYLEEAARDMPGLPVGEFFARFIGWTRP
jgi:hypothetical protein